VGRGTLIGMGAILLSGTVIGHESIVAAGSLVTEGKVFPPRSLIMGSPAKVVREVTEEQLERVRMICNRYRDLAAEYAAGRFPALGSDINKETWEAAL
jgi:carbonic anhydrase/acetyltransferase-like protein (isoleucine patch superfamily)